MEKKLRVGIAGYGVVGKRRRVFIDQNPHFRTVAVSDITFPQEESETDGIKCFRSYDRLFGEKLDILFVCLPNNIAAGVTIEGLHKNLHVFCEKPPGCCVEDIERVRETEKRHPGLKLKYGFNHRYHDSVIETKRIIESGNYGPIVNLRGVYGKSAIIPFSGGWRSERNVAGGGILLDQGIHMLDMIRYFAGDFEEIKSFVPNSYWNHDVEDNAYAIMRNRAGVVAMLHSTATQWQHRFRLEITLKDALLELSGILSGSKSYGNETVRVIPRKDGSMVGSFEEDSITYLEDNSWRDEINEFADLVVNDKPVLNGNSKDALDVMKLVFRIYCADQQWKDAFNIKEPK